MSSEYTIEQLDELDLDRKRMKEAAFVFIGTPVNLEHQKRREKIYSANIQASQEDAKVSSTFRVEERIKLCPKKYEQWIEADAKFDTGANDNWIAESLAEERGAVIEEGPPVYYNTFTGENLKSTKLVRRLTWTAIGKSGSLNTDFRIAPSKATFKVLFGKEFIESEEIFTFNKAALILTKRKETTEAKEKRKAKELEVEEEADALLMRRDQAQGSGGCLKGVDGAKDKEGGNDTRRD
ncbi:hypothetical protein BGZ60DRAFT_431835 [Tricladium varicosporioides]|nr:hypothetical protein BGZ60DRAFT_431835 [Hymenoscyphus varicosporioides]